jgi:hypothetical protein
MNTIKEFHKNAIEFQKSEKKGEGINAIVEGDFLITEGTGIITGSIHEMMFERSKFSHHEIIYGIARTLIGIDVLASALGTSIMEVMQAHNEAVMKEQNESKQHSS